MSTRVHELAKELKLTSKELLEKLQALHVDVKSHMSLLTDENVNALKQSLAKPKDAPTVVKKEAERKEGAASSIENASENVVANSSQTNLFAIHPDFKANHRNLAFVVISTLSLS